MKRCTRCKKRKKRSNFHVNKRRSDGLNSWCSRCQSDYAKQYRQRHRSQTRRRQRIKSRRKLIDRLKNKPCIDCKGRFPPICMDFDHVPGHDKIETIAMMVTNCRPIAKILEEVAKCELVCANCHRIRTALRHGKEVHWPENRRS